MRMLDPSPAVRRLAGRSCSPPWSLPRCSDGGSGDAAPDEQSPEEVLAAAKKQLDETSGVRSDPHAPTTCPPASPASPKADGVGTHDPAFEGTITVVLSRADRRRAGRRGRRQGLRPAAVHAGLAGRSTPADYGAPDPAALMSADARLLLAARRHRGRRGGRQRPRRRRQQRGPHRATPAPSPATSSKNVIPSAVAATSTRRTPSPTTASCARPCLTGVVLPGRRPDDLHVDLRRLRHRQGHHRAVSAGRPAGRRDRPAAAAARRWRRSRSRSRRPTPTSSCSRCRT